MLFLLCLFEAADQCLTLERPKRYQMKLFLLAPRLAIHVTLCPILCARLWRGPFCTAVVHLASIYSKQAHASLWCRCRSTTKPFVDRQRRGVVMPEMLDLAALPLEVSRAHAVSLGLIRQLCTKQVVSSRHLLKLPLPI